VLGDNIQGVVYHAADSGETTWYGFAREFLRLAAEMRPDLQMARLIPVPSSHYPTPTRRPENSRLNCERLQQVFNFTMAPWKESAADVIAEVFQNPAFAL
jgi:dTDP-4-dehydrorhamnose reductase